jgi:hypothetical protein
LPFSPFSTQTSAWRCVPLVRSLPFDSSCAPSHSLSEASSLRESRKWRSLCTILTGFCMFHTCRAILDGLTPGPLSVSCSLGYGTNRTQVSLHHGGRDDWLISENLRQGLFIEMFCTAALVLSVLMLAAESESVVFVNPRNAYTSVYQSQSSHPSRHLGLGSCYGRLNCFP